MLDPELCGGVRTRIGLALPHFAAGYSDTVERIDHIGIASADNRRAEELYANRLGFKVESRQTDMETRAVFESFTSDRYGVVHHARTPEAVGGLRVNFITVGDCELKFLPEFDSQAMSESRDLELGRAPGTTQGDQGAIGRFIARQGAGLHHLAIKTPDINGALAKLQEAGVRTIDNVGRPGSRRAQIGFIHPSATGGILIHFVEREPLPE
jgi:methylmalonyl-CoA/ethylmalonyl-CoA epimerase